jgi:hypothetical protein
MAKNAHGINPKLAVVRQVTATGLAAFKASGLTGRPPDDAGVLAV